MPAHDREYLPTLRPAQRELQPVGGSGDRADAVCAKTRCARPREWTPGRTPPCSVEIILYAACNIRPSICNLRVAPYAEGVVRKRDTARSRRTHVDISAQVGQP